MALSIREVSVVRFVVFMVVWVGALTCYGQDPSQLSSCRVRVGNVCGSGGIVRHADDVTLVLTNAHVVGTTIGRQVSTEWWNPDGTSFTVPGRVIVSAYADRTSTDWAIVRVQDSRLGDRVAYPLGDGTGPELTTGAPRCEWLSTRILRVVGEGPIRRAFPVAIGGQSGSLTVRQCNTVGLVTWTDGTHTIMQSSSKIAHQWRDANVAGGPIKEAGWQFAGEWMECSEGFHAEVGYLSVDITAPAGPCIPDPAPEDPGEDKETSRIERLVILAIEIIRLLRDLGIVSDGR
jgi:RNase P/RNase MRP subunit p29